MKSVSDITSLLTARRLRRGADWERMRVIAKSYNSDIILPLPEIEKREMPAVANLIAVGIDSHAQRVASVLPEVNFPPKDPKVPLNVKYAGDRRRACLSWLEEVDYDVLLHQRARYLIAYGHSPIIVRPDENTGIPTFDVRNPLDSYVAPPMSVNDMLPVDGIFVYPRTLSWLVDNYPEKAAFIARSITNPDAFNSRDYRLELIEYRSKDQITLAVGGAGTFNWGLMSDDFQISQWNTPQFIGWATELSTVENRTGYAGIVNPTRVTLDRHKGQFDDMVGVMQMQSRAMGLYYHAAIDSVFPNTWWVSPEGSAGDIVVEANGKRGITGVVEGGNMMVLNPQPGQAVGPMMDRLSENARISGAVGGDTTGDSASGIRTGNRARDLLSAQIDFHIAEHQMLLAKSLKRELQHGMRVAKTYFPDRPQQFYCNWPGAQGQVDYKASVIFGDSEAIIVEYAQAGYDAQTLAVDTGQRVGLKLMSRLTGMKRDPAVRDPEREHGQVLYESMEDALIQRVQQEVGTPGALPTEAIISMMADVQAQIPLDQAYLSAHQKMQQMQAAQQQEEQGETSPDSEMGPGEPPGGQNAAGGPYGQPGLDAGTPLDTGTPPVGAFPQALQNLRQGLRSIKGSVGAA